MTIATFSSGRRSAGALTSAAFPLPVPQRKAQILNADFTWCKAAAAFFNGAQLCRPQPSPHSGGRTWLPVRGCSHPNPWAAHCLGELQTLSCLSASAYLPERRERCNLASSCILLVSRDNFMLVKYIATSVPGPRRGILAERRDVEKCLHQYRMCS